LEQIRKAIPRHCFKKWTPRAFSYVLGDVSSFAITNYLFHKLVTENTVPIFPIRFLLWIIYGFIQGLFLTALWVIAHECGHNNSSPSRTVSDAVGFILRSILLAPYFSWQVTHAKHHRATGNMEREMTYVPRRRDQYAASQRLHPEDLDYDIMESLAIIAIALMLRGCFGLPVYLWTNATSLNNYWRQKEGRGIGKKNGLFGRVNHYDPRSRWFESKDSKKKKKKVLVSDLGVLLFAVILVIVGKRFGWSNLFLEYFIPWLWSNHWQCKLHSFIGLSYYRLH
jgi:omega-6 fatty acid desaturase / acyl-lipid omega-6 desaturase (Delta-12 desaturase)